jgi:hypothetical protein
MEKAKFIIDRLRHKVLKIPYEFYDNMSYSKILESPGIYSWRIAPLNAGENKAQRLSSLSSYTSFFKPNDISLKGSNYFNQYDGKIQEVVSEKLQFQEKIESLSSLDNYKYLDLLVSLFLFTAPLYIGISDNLKFRISEHYNLICSSYETRDKSQVESDLNSSDFGKRLSSFISLQKEANPGISFPPSCFYVSILYLDSYTKSELESIEFLLNRIIKPKFGRR